MVCGEIQAGFKRQRLFDARSTRYSGKRPRRGLRMDTYRQQRPCLVTRALERDLQAGVRHFERGTRCA